MAGARSDACYIKACLGQVPLETLSSELQKYVTVLKGKLVEVINEDYNDFVSLSTKLVNVDGAVTQMQKPLLSLKVLPRSMYAHSHASKSKLVGKAALLQTYISHLKHLNQRCISRIMHAGSTAGCTSSC